MVVLQNAKIPAIQITINQRTISQRTIRLWQRADFALFHIFRTAKSRGGLLALSLWFGLYPAAVFSDPRHGDLTALAQALAKLDLIAVMQYRMPGGRYGGARVATRFSVKGKKLHIAVLDTEYSIRRKPEQIEIWVKETDQSRTVDFADLSPALYLQDLAGTSYSGPYRYVLSETGAIVLRCKGGDCVRRDEQVTKRCLFGCSNIKGAGKSKSRPRRVTKDDSIYLPVHDPATGRRVAGLLERLISAHRGKIDDQTGN